jgi:hypothetical protein
MGRRYHRTHLLKESVNDGFWEPHRLSDGSMSEPRPKIVEHGFCGEWSYSKFMTFLPIDTDREPECPKCSAAWGKLRLIEIGAERVTCEKLDPGPYRTLYSCSVEGEMVAFIGMAAGYGATWQLSRIVMHGDEPTPEHIERNRHNGYHSREAAMVNAFRMRARTDNVQLKSLTELKIFAVGRAAERERRRIAYAAQCARDLEDFNTAIAALESLLARPTDALTNLERSGAMIALERLRKDEKEDRI